MVNKSIKIDNEPASNDPLTEIEQLRHLVFGQAKLELELKIKALDDKLDAQVSDLQSQIEKNFDDLTQQSAQQHKETLAAISELQNIQQDDKSELLNANEQLLSQLEMAENAGKDDAQSIHQRIDSEVAQLDASLKSGVEDMLQRLEQVTQDLSSSKTDRKTLAQLLATMATDLQSN